MEAMTSEREAFEALIRQWPSYSEKLLMRDRHAPGDYDSLVVQGAWEGWKARAHLAQPAQAVDVGAIPAEAVPVGEASLLPGVVTKDWAIQTSPCCTRIVDERMAYGWNEYRKAMLATRALSGEKAGPVGDDTRLLDALRDNSWDLRCFNTCGGEDVGWEIVEHHMAKPCERTIVRVYKDDPRKAIASALSLPASTTPGKEGA